MKSIFVWGVVILVLVVIVGCTSKKAPMDSSSYHKISAEEAKEMMDEGSVIIVDVRTPSEYATSHIENAINIPNEEIEDTKPSALLNLDDVILVYCRSGMRSREASNKLVQMGYTQIYDFGGIMKWPYALVQGVEENDE